MSCQAKDKNNLGRTLYGVVGGGVRGIERVLPPADKRIVTTTRSHGTGLVNDCAEACKPTEVIRVGGAGHKVMLLIEGKAHAYVFPSPGNMIHIEKVSWLEHVLFLNTTMKKYMYIGIL